jgi:hypothetical protein
VTPEELSNFGNVVSALERIATALEVLGKAQNKLAMIEGVRLKHDIPLAKPKRPAEFTRPTDEKKEQFSDRADSEWIDETERTASRFQQRLEDTEGNTAAQAGSSRKNQGSTG